MTVLLFLLGPIALPFIVVFVILINSDDARRAARRATRRSPASRGNR